MLSMKIVTGAEKPIYDTRYQKCIEAKVLTISGLQSAREYITFIAVMVLHLNRY